MAFRGQLALVVIVALFVFPSTSLAKKMNVIDACWRSDPQWRNNRGKLATCSVGFAGKMTGLVGPDVTYYEVTDPSDDNPVCPKPGTLRFGVTQIKGKVWITFKKNMNIKLQKPLLVGSYTAIDGRGANVHIAHGACITILEVSRKHNILIMNKSFAFRKRNIIVVSCNIY